MIMLSSPIGFFVAWKSKEDAIKFAEELLKYANNDSIKGSFVLGTSDTRIPEEELQKECIAFKSWLDYKKEPDNE